MSRIGQIRERIAPIRGQLLNHPVYQAIGNVAHLRVFAEHHVFAVWDFMSLLKALQNEITCTTVPWTPSRLREESRLINEIVLDEESDVAADGTVVSHFDMYVDAIGRFGANLTPIQRFAKTVRTGMSIEHALHKAGIAGPRADFVLSTFEIINYGDISAIASAFTFGREDLLPDVFTQVVQEIGADHSGQLDPFIYYLQRHIELDGDEHGHRAEALVEKLCGDDVRAWQAASSTATYALQSRLKLWDAVHREIVDAAPAEDQSNVQPSHRIVA